MAARACQDVRVTNDDEEMENWTDEDDGVHVQCVCVATEAGSDQNL